MSEGILLLLLTFFHFQNPEDVGTSGQCYTPQVQSFRTCNNKVFAASGIGAGVSICIKLLSCPTLLLSSACADRYTLFSPQATILPDHVGLPFSETDKRVFVNLEIHYDNPNRIGICNYLMPKHYPLKNVFFNSQLNVAIAVNIVRSVFINRSMNYILL